MFASVSFVSVRDVWFHVFVFVYFKIVFVALTHVSWWCSTCAWLHMVCPVHGRRRTLAQCKGERRNCRATAKKWKYSSETLSGTGTPRLARTLSLFSGVSLAVSRVRTLAPRCFPLTPTDGHRQRRTPTDTDSRRPARHYLTRADLNRHRQTLTDGEGRH